MKAATPFLAIASLSLCCASVFAAAVAPVPVVDKTPPVITITYPANNAQVTDGSAPIIGKATDAGGVAGVTILFQGVTYPASGTTNWNFSTDSQGIAFSPGTNTFRAWATDRAGNNSLAIKRTFFYAVPSTLTVATVDDGSGTGGTVSGVTDQETLLINKSYRATARPSRGWIFADWSDGNGTLLGTNPVLNFIMQDSELLVARFVTNLFVPLKGSYRGLYGVDNLAGRTNSAPLTNSVVGAGKSGFVAVTTTTTGAFSGRFLWRGSSFPISGAFQDYQDGTAAADVAIPRGTNAAATISLHLVIATNPKLGGFGGTVTLSNKVFNIFGQKAKYVAAHPRLGRYNLAVGPLGDGGDSSVPQGFGFGSAIVGAGGAVTLTLSMPDSAEPLTFSSGMNADGTFAFYIPRNTGGGLLIGWLQFTNLTTLDVRGSNVTWNRPATASSLYPGGFTFQPLPIFGVRYPGTSAGGQLGWTSGVIHFTGDTIGGGFGNQLSYKRISNTLKVTDDNSAQLKVTFDPATGTFSGTFLSPSQTYPGAQAFQGIIIPKSSYAPIPYGVGYFINASESGRVILGPF